MFDRVLDTPMVHTISARTTMPNIQDRKQLKASNRLKSKNTFLDHQTDLRNISHKITVSSSLIELSLSSKIREFQKSNQISLREKDPNTDQKKLGIWTLFTQCMRIKVLFKDIFKNVRLFHLRQRKLQCCKNQKLLKEEKHR